MIGSRRVSKSVDLWLSSYRESAKLESAKRKDTDLSHLLHGRSSDGPGFDGSPRNRRQGEARAVDLPARSIDPVALVVAPPLLMAPNKSSQFSLS